MQDPLTVSGAAREISATLGYVVRPRDITDLFYARKVDDTMCPIVSGRRLISRACLPSIIAALEAKRNARGA